MNLEQVAANIRPNQVTCAMSLPVHC